MFCLTINVAITMHTETQSFEMFDILHFLVLSYKIQWEKGYFKFLSYFKVHLHPKYFFRVNKSLHLFETHFAILNLILTFL